MKDLNFTKNVLKKSILFIFMISLSSLIYSQWTSLNGPGGGYINMPGFAVHDNASAADEIFVYSGDNVFMSVNDGVSWVETEGKGLPVNNQATLAACGDYLYAAIPGYDNINTGVFVSSDNGNNWTSANNGLPASYAVIRSLAVIGSNVFAGSAFGYGVYISSDNGQNWTAVNTGLTNKQVSTLYANGTNLYAGTKNGIYVSSNNGQSWTSISNGIPANMEVYAIIKNKSGLFAAVDGSSYNKMYYSSDGGLNWTVIQTGFPLSMSDGPSLLATDSINVYAGCDGSGVYKTSDDGLNWNAVNNGLTQDLATRISSLGLYNSKIYAGTNMKGIYTSSDNGSSWQKSNIGLASSPVTAISFIGDSLIAGTSSSLGIFFYDKINQTWTTGISKEVISANKTYAIGVNGNTIFYGDVNGLYVSNDRGKTWTKDLTTGNYITAIVVDNGTVYLGLDNTKNIGVLKSVDNGATWTPIITGLTSNRVVGLAVKGNELYAGTAENGVFKSTDGGSNWTAINTGITDLDIKCISLINGYLYVGTGGTPTGGIFVSSDGGLNWTAIGSAYRLANLNARAFAGNSTAVYTAISSGTLTNAGIYYTTDNGLTWNNANIARHALVNTLATDNNYLYVGTQYGGVMRMPLIQTGNKPLQASSPVVFPNPAKGTIYLKNQNDYIGGNYSIFNLLGKELLSGRILTSFVKVDLPHIKKGIYILKISKGSIKKTEKIIVE